MRLPNTKLIVFNAAAAIVGLAAVVAAAQYILNPAVIASCAERYHSLTGFALERAGVTLTAADLQSSGGGRDVGVMENVAIGPVKDGPAPLAMAVALRQASSQQNPTEPKGGATFPWEPRVLQGKTSACLSYQVLFPASFDFHRGGALPGIAGADASEQGDKFLARLAWRPKALGGATLRVMENGTTRSLLAERQGFQFPQGKWVKLEQEVVLNTPKNSDGILRVWVDGTLAIERTDMTYRAKPDVMISNVSVDVFYGSGPDDVQFLPSKDAKVWLTPFEVRWQ